MKLPQATFLVSYFYLRYLKLNEWIIFLATRIYRKSLQELYVQKLWQNFFYKLSRSKYVDGWIVKNISQALPKMYVPTSWSANTKKMYVPTSWGANTKKMYVSTSLSANTKKMYAPASWSPNTKKCMYQHL